MSKRKNELVSDSILRPRVASKVITPADLNGADRARMHTLMTQHFTNISAEQFERDLNEKDWVVVIQNDDLTIQGFTTLKVLELEDDGERIVAFYSGDTILSPDYWGERGWLSTWSRHVFLSAEKFPDATSYWILLTATHRTYQFLPAFFHDFYPNEEHPTPTREKRILDTFVRMKFPKEYDAEHGIVTLHDATPVRHPEDVEAMVPQEDKYAKYFVQLNPGYLNGNFLACMTRIDRSNVTRLGWRVLGELPPLSNA